MTAINSYLLKYPYLDDKDSQKAVHLIMTDDITGGALTCRA